MLPPIYNILMQYLHNTTVLSHNHTDREELYPMPYDKIDWNAARSQIAKEDLYYPHPMIQVTPATLGILCWRGGGAGCPCG